MSEKSTEISMLGRNVGEKIDQAAAEVISVVAGETSKGVVEFTGDILGGLLGDRVREWRTRNLINSTAKTAEFLKQKGIPLDKARALPMGEMYEIFEGMSKTDASEIRDLYSGLLANAMNPASDITAEKSFVSIIQQLSPKDAAVLEFINFAISADKKFEVEQSAKFKSIEVEAKKLSQEARMDEYREIQEKSQKKRRSLETEKNTEFERLGLSGEMETATSVQNLLRLGLIAANAQWPVHGNLSNMTIRTDLEDSRGYRLQLLDARKTLQMIAGLSEHLKMNSGEQSSNRKFHKLRSSVGMGGHRLNYVFTSFGNRLMAACK